MLNSFNLALKSIWSNKMRSFLTMLGIIIGVAAVIILVGIVNGEMSYMTSSFASMGTNRITVNVTNLSSRSVSVDQMYDFYEENGQYFSHLSPTVSVSATVKVGNENSDETSVTGVSEDYLDIMDYDLEKGRFIQYADIAARQKVAVIGLYVAQTYYETAEKAIGQRISVNGTKYQIEGVVERQTSESDEMSEGGSDDFVYIPYTAAVKLSRNGTINNYTFTLRDDYVEEASTVTTVIEDFLYTIFKNDDLYRVTAMSELLDSMNEMIAQMSLMLGGIAGISLLVAGVGVMNIMLVSVTERTREIGIRKALGAKKSTILLQFVIEAAVTSSMGGIIGIVIGCIGTTVAGKIMAIDAQPSIGWIIASFTISMSIGLIFGYMPARSAATLNPIDALRSD
ncbi:ABC transporter permease [Oribacterium sp. P6A1]|uniref:ABC transporter permease n=1 Tax=Oribacterium sp. P6A1 TaxID=1410612 RepID=UPI00056293E0|nr:ABC transporter permease [Oribacterium sp. P6A1]